MQACFRMTCRHGDLKPGGKERIIPYMGKERAGILRFPAPGPPKACASERLFHLRERRRLTRHGRERRTSQREETEPPRRRLGLGPLRGCPRGQPDPSPDSAGQHPAARENTSPIREARLLLLGLSRLERHRMEPQERHPQPRERGTLGLQPPPSPQDRRR